MKYGPAFELVSSLFDIIVGSLHRRRRRRYRRRRRRYRRRRRRWRR